jgi:hypothetical protein
MNMLLYEPWQVLGNSLRYFLRRPMTEEASFWAMLENDQIHYHILYGDCDLYSMSGNVETSCHINLHIGITSASHKLWTIDY